jgi:nitroreductase
MDVIEAVSSRRSVRAFLSRPVPEETIRRVLALAARAPSGGNLQPWHIDVVAGEPLVRLKALMRGRVAETPEGEPTEYDVYPKSLWSPYRERRFKLGEDMYEKLRIPREDKEARRRRMGENFQCFGAPLVLFCSIDRRMGAPQWSDLGMYLQTTMLLLRGEGLDSCAQEIWSLYPQTLGCFLGLPPERMLFCGMSIGYADPTQPVNDLRSERAPLEEFVSFHGL